jgi:hypothetical protein
VTRTTSIPRSLSIATNSLGAPASVTKTWAGVEQSRLGGAGKRLRATVDTLQQAHLLQQFEVAADRDFRDAKVPTQGSYTDTLLLLHLLQDRPAPVVGAGDIRGARGRLVTHSEVSLSIELYHNVGAAKV